MISSNSLSGFSMQDPLVRWWWCQKFWTLLFFHFYVQQEKEDRYSLEAMAFWWQLLMICTCHFWTEVETTPSGGETLPGRNLLEMLTYVQTWKIKEKSALHHRNGTGRRVACTYRSGRPILKRKTNCWDLKTQTWSAQPLAVVRTGVVGNGPRGVKGLIGWSRELNDEVPLW